ncbi:MAG: NADP-dependent phosphogluconate dehydrogenase [Limnochordaceae bacterium]|nr:NADP-dependent phosphogluconate dehydrogenase [Limnochordaceae bacterium]
MVPAGEPVDRTLFDPSHGIQALLEPGDVVIDGGNSFYEDSRRRARELRERAGAWLVDCGSSGGVEGAEQGLCLMVGGQPEAVEVAFPLLQALAAPGGLAHVGPPGAGHFVKMVHNAVEYGMLQAIGEGFELLSAAPFALDLHQVADLWTHGSVVRGWLMELLARALARDPRLEGLRGVVGGGETGGWAIQEAWRRGVPFSTLASAYAMRLRSRQEESVAAKVVAALRREFGGHSVTPARQAAGGER